MAAQRLGAATLETLLAAIDANDAETGGHVRRVAAFALALADAAALDDGETHSIERVALFHDIGKLDEALSDIFHDSKKLTPAERRAVMTHPERGADVLEPLAAFYPDLQKGVLSHHERWDGSGYPKKLRGRRIPLSARVVAIADTFDAVTHRRRYSEGRSFREGVEVIAEGRGTQFDPELVDLFLSPPVLLQVRRIMHEFHLPKKRGRRSTQPRKKRTPDVTFRWRQPSRAQRPRHSTGRK
jgi:HD-GYP domain-containing protein (c-di-GMP phosphodiesterase class II)